MDVAAVDAAGGVPERILIATASEVSLALDAQRQLAAEGILSRLVSNPSWSLFKAQSPEYRQAVLPPGSAREGQRGSGLAFRLGALSGAGRRDHRRGQLQGGRRDPRSWPIRFHR